MKAGATGGPGTYRGDMKPRGVMSLVPAIRAIGLT